MQNVLLHYRMAPDRLTVDHQLTVNIATHNGVIWAYHTLDQELA
jgi:hypothetical protein